MQLSSGTTLQGGKYKINKALGQGGFGITYLASLEIESNQSLGKIRTTVPVTIKEFFMKEHCNRDASTSRVSISSQGAKELVENFKRKFIKEAKTLASLEHPNIIKIYDVFEENGTAYYVMEYIDGGSLSDYISQNGPMPEKTAIQYIIQVAGALDYLHSRKMNHLDVKPGNILLNAADNAILIDFGLSKHYDDEGQATSTTPVGISHGYAPMEQYKRGGVNEFSPATDIYSLGATLYKLLTGQTPPDASDINDEGLPAMPNNISASTQRAIEVAMQPRRKDRPQSITAFLSLLGKTNYAGSPTSDDTVFDMPSPNTVSTSTSEPIIEVVSEEYGFWATFKRDWRNRPLITNLILMSLFIGSLCLSSAALYDRYNLGYSIPLWPVSLLLYLILGIYLIIRNKGEYILTSLLGLLMAEVSSNYDGLPYWVVFLLLIFVLIVSMLIKKNNIAAWKYLMQNNGKKNNIFIQLKNAFIIVLIPIIFYLFCLDPLIGHYTAESIICILVGFTIHFSILSIKGGNKSKLLYWILLALSFYTAYWDWHLYY